MVYSSLSTTVLPIVGSAISSLSSSSSSSSSLLSENAWATLMFPPIHIAACQIVQQQHELQQQQQHKIVVPRGGGKQNKMSIAQRFYNLPEPARYFVSGNIGNLIFFSTERIVTAIVMNYSTDDNTDWTASFTFFTAYLLHIPGQHFVHAWLVYGLDTISTAARYRRTLRGLYSALTTAAIGSTFLNSILIQHLSKNVAFVCTLALFAVVNYFVVGWMMKAAPTAATTTTRRSSKTRN